MLKGGAAEEKVPLLSPVSTTTTTTTTTTPTTTTTTTATPYVLYTRRWLMLFLFSLVTMNQCGMWITYGTLADTTQKIYGVSPAMVNLLAAFGPIAYFPFALHSSWAINALGLKKTVFIASLASAVGAILRSCAWTPETYWLVMVGQILNAAAGPIAMTVPPTLSAIWFGPHERTLATSIGANANGAGSPISFFLSLLVTNSKSFFNLMYGETIFIVVTTIAVFILFEDKPPTPACTTSSMTKTDAHTPNAHSDMTVKQYLVDSWKLLKNPHTFNVIFTMGTVSGVSSSWSAMLVLTLAGLGYSESQGQLVGLLNGLIGIIAATTFIGKLHDKFGHYKRIMVVTYAIFFVLMAVFSMTTSTILHKYFTAPFWVILIITSLSGIAQNALYPLSYEALAELSFPTSETVGSALLSFLINVFSLIYLFVGDYISANWANYSFTITVGLAVISTLFLREQYKRSDIDKLQPGAVIQINTEK